MIWATGSECAGKDRCVILFREPDSTQVYLYQVAGDGSVQVRLWDGQEYTQLIGWKDSEARVWDLPVEQVFLNASPEVNITKIMSNPFGHLRKVRCV